MQSILNLRYLELFTNVAWVFCSTMQKWKNFVISPDKIAFSLPTKWGGFYKTDNTDWRRFIKCLHFKRDKTAFSLPTKWGDFYITDNADRRGFIKCLHFKRDKIAFSLPSKWEKNFLRIEFRFLLSLQQWYYEGLFYERQGLQKNFWKQMRKKEVLCCSVSMRG